MDERTSGSGFTLMLLVAALLFGALGFGGIAGELRAVQALAWVCAAFAAAGMALTFLRGPARRR